MTNDDIVRKSASQSFRKHEIDAMCQLVDILYRGSSHDAVVRSLPIRKVFAKFKRMQNRVSCQENGNESTP